MEEVGVDGFQHPTHPHFKKKPTCYTRSRDVSLDLLRILPPPPPPRKQLWQRSCTISHVNTSEDRRTHILTMLAVKQIFCIISILTSILTSLYQFSAVLGSLTNIFSRFQAGYLSSDLCVERSTFSTIVID